MNKSSVIFISIGLMLLCAAFGLLLHNEYTSLVAEAEAEKMLYQLKVSMLDNASEELVYSESPGEMATISLDGMEIVGTVSIPAIAVELPVAAQWDYQNLKTAACRYSGTAAGGRLIIMAHNYRRHFSRLGELIEGDEVQFLDVNGKLYEYTVAAVETLDQNALSELTGDDSDLTLFTCNYDATKRITVRCSMLR